MDLCIILDYQIGVVVRNSTAGILLNDMSYDPCLWNPHNSEITLRLLDNNNCYNLYRDETSNVHVTEEIFTLLTINNYNVVETGGVIDFTLILGNHVDSYLYGLLSVTNGWYRGSLTKLVLF